MTGSESENNGLAAMAEADLQVYSIGISTGGVAEIRMVEANPNRHVVATTIDEQGLKDAQRFITEKGYDEQITSKLEDVSQKLPYEENFFDFIYARLVLHYLSKQTLPHALQELKRVLKPAGKLFVVVRSVECPDANREGKTYDAETGYTTYPTLNKEKPGHTQTRFFHTQDSIRQFMADAGFNIKYVRSYKERLFTDFMRTNLSDYVDDLIETEAVK